MIRTTHWRAPHWRWVPVGLWMALIFFMSAQSSSGEQSGALARLVYRVIGAEPEPEALASLHHMIRKGAHFTEYAILAMLMAWAQRGLSVGRAAVTWGAATLYAVSDEWHQSFVPNRGPAATDVLIDAMGALAGILASLALSRRR